MATLSKESTQAHDMIADQNTIEAIKAHPVYIQILAESCGGVIYNVANRDKYEKEELLALWESLSDSWQESAGGIMKGAMNFIAGN